MIVFEMPHGLFSLYCITCVRRGFLMFRFVSFLQDDKYILKYHTCAVAGGDSGKGSEARFNPISKTSLILGRNSAVDKNIFFLINQGSSQMMELTAPSSSECKS